MVAMSDEQIIYNALAFTCVCFTAGCLFSLIPNTGEWWQMGLLFAGGSWVQLVLFVWFCE